MTITFDDIIKSVEEDNLAFVKDVHELFLNKRGSSGAEIDMFAPYQPFTMING